MFGSPETTTGGNALKFYSSVRMRVSRIGAIKESGGAGRDPEVVGNRTRVKVTKNKMAPPFREHEFDILYGRGISQSGDVLDLAVNLGIVEKSGSWYSFDGERLGQGREKVRQHLEDNPDLLVRIENIVRAKHDLPIIGGVSPEKEDASPSDAQSSDDEDGTKSSSKSNGKAKPNGKASARA
jgi:recombination protein RecA